MSSQHHRDYSAVAGISAATLHEAAGRRGALPGAIAAVSDRFRLCGPAYPVRCPPGDNLWLHRAVYAAEPGEILVVDVGGGYDFGYWGEVLTRAAIARRLGGLVIDGGVRDRDQLIAAGLPVFSRGLRIQGTVKDPAGAGAIGDPIELGSVTVARGDLVVGDSDGVVVIDAASALAAAAAGRLRDEKEADMMIKLDQGATTLDLLGLR
jgi:4-hydroxy-4-methyl-2-oxoglutarate aldolase